MVKILVSIFIQFSLGHSAGARHKFNKNMPEVNNLCPIFEIVYLYSNINSIDIVATTVVAIITTKINMNPLMPALFFFHVKKNPENKAIIIPIR